MNCFFHKCNTGSLIIAVILLWPGLYSDATAGPQAPDVRNLAAQFPPDNSDQMFLGDFDDLENFEVYPATPLVGATSDYELSFQLGKGDYHKLDRGGFAFDFPYGFDLESITDVSIHDDQQKPRYEVKRFSSTRHFLIITLKKIHDDDDDDDDDGDDKSPSIINISLRISQIENTSEPGFYQIVGLAFDKKRRPIAGPTFSEPFEIIGSGAAGLIVLPEGDQTLPVGGSISFSAWSVDQSGNVLGEVDAVWSFTQDSDPIGSLSGSLFTAESVGNGQLKAVYGDFEALSGLITVLSGPSLSYVPGSLTPLVVFAGVESEFSFDIALEESFPDDVTISQALFTIAGDGFENTTLLATAGDLLHPGVNTMSSEKIYVPQSQVGNNLDVSVSIVYSPVSNPDLKLTFISDLDNVTVTVEPTPVVQIISVEASSFNAPRVNTGQAFRISTRVANLSDNKVTSLPLRLSSDGSSAFEPALIIPEINPRDTIEAFFEIIASAIPNEHEHFVVDFGQSDIGQVTPVDNTTFVIIQTPADLELSYSLLGLSNGVVHPGSVFSLTVELNNNGEASASDAQYALDTDSVDFGNEFDATGTLAVDDHLVFLFKAPPLETSAVISFALTDVSLDLNTGQQAIVGSTSFQFTVTVRESKGELSVEINRGRLNLIMPGRPKSLLSMKLVNMLDAKTFSIELKSLSVSFFSDGRPVDASSEFDLWNTAFYTGNFSLSEVTASGNRLDFTFQDFVIAPLRVRLVELVAVALNTNRRDITLELDIADIEARYVDGPAEGEEVLVTSPGDSIVSFDYVYKGPTLEQSVVIENNPFNPEEQLMNFTYELPIASDVEFRILTLTGEEVFSLDIPFGGPGASRIGENEISWDGRNDKGHAVLNGVYVVFIRIVETGESSRTKVAVVK